MKCPKCNKKMDGVYEKMETYDKAGKKYLRRVYHCKDDDIWVSVEVPKLSSRTN